MLLLIPIYYHKSVRKSIRKKDFFPKILPFFEGLNKKTADGLAVGSRSFIKLSVDCGNGELDIVNDERRILCSAEAPLEEAILRLTILVRSSRNLS